MRKVFLGGHCLAIVEKQKDGRIEFDSQNTLRAFTEARLILVSLSTRVFETQTATGSELF